MSDECDARDCARPEDTPATYTDEYGHTFCDATCAGKEAVAQRQDVETVSFYTGWASL